VADFGFARIKEENATMTRCGSPCWTGKVFCLSSLHLTCCFVAPEIIQGKKYTEKADVYSVCVMF
jgi:serine/threonine protein kinase